MIPERAPKVPRQLPTDAELLRDVLSAFAHDLGGVSSALSLWADALGSAASGSGVVALHALAEEVRALGRHARQLHGSRGPDTLSTVRSGSLRTWWSLIARVGNSCVGRSIDVRGTIDDVEIAPEQAHALTYVVLALFRDLSARGLKPPASVTVVAASTPSGVVVTVTPAHSNIQTPLLLRRATTWVGFARRTASSAGLSMAEAGGTTRLTIPLQKE